MITMLLYDGRLDQLACAVIGARHANVDCVASYRGGEEHGERGTYNLCHDGQAQRLGMRLIEALAKNGAAGRGDAHCGVECATAEPDP